MRLGVDVGGTKIEVAVLDAEVHVALRRRAVTLHGACEEALQVLAALIMQVEREAGEACTVGVGIPGRLAPRTGLVKNAYNTPFKGRPPK